jgi:hypothetical protein
MAEAKSFPIAWRVEPALVTAENFAVQRAGIDPRPRDASVGMQPRFICLLPAAGDGSTEQQDHQAKRQSGSARLSGVFPKTGASQNHKINQ